MTTQPEALRLADAIGGWYAPGHASLEDCDQAAAELRRLYAENQQWRSVFGHLGTPDEIGNEWIELQDNVTYWKEEAKRYSANADYWRDKNNYNETLLCQALEQLEINRTNFLRAPSKSICKMLASGNDKLINKLRKHLGDTK